MKIRNNIQTGLNTYASYSVAGLVNQNLSGVNTTRLKLTGNTSYNFGTASTSSLYSYIVEAGTYSFNLGTYSNYKVLSSDFPAIGSTGSGLTGSFTLDGLFDGSSMWIKSQLGFFDMPKPAGATGGGGDADATAYLAAVVSAGGTVNGTITTAVNTLFTDLKSAGLYTKVKRLYPIIGSTQNSCSLEAKLTGSNILWNNVGSFVFNSNGITCDGVNTRNPAYINETPYAIFGSNNNIISFCMYNRTNRGDEANFPISASIGGSNNYFQMNINYDGNHYSAIGTAFLTLTAGSSQGLFMASRTSDASMKFYRNGTSLGEWTTTGNSLTNSSIIGLFDLTTDNYAFLSLNDGLTDGEASSFYTIVQAFQTSLGRNV